MENEPQKDGGDWLGNVLPIAGFACGAIVGFQIGARTIPETAGSPFYWLLFALAGAWIGCLLVRADELYSWFMIFLTLVILWGVLKY